MTTIDAPRPNRRGWNLRALNADSERQRAVRANVRPESLSANGRKGWEVTRARWGSKWAIEMLAAYRREHPSRIVRTVIAWLDEFCVAHELELRIGDTFADIACADFRLIVEVDSDRYHGPLQSAVDRRKDELYRSHGWRVLRLAEANIKSGAAKDLLDLALHSAQYSGVLP